MAIKILHFADAHIDIANYGRHDPESGLPLRVGDFLRSLDQIVNTAIEKEVDLVIFAGDAYKDRNPQPTFQRAWGERMMKLSRAGIPTLLLIGNHDIAPAEGRAHTLQEYATLAVPHIFVADRLKLWRPEEIGVPVQVLAIPWVTRSRLLARKDLTGKTTTEIYDAIHERLEESLEQVLDQDIDPSLPLILTAHASIQGAQYGSERLVMLGQDLILNKSLVSDPRIDYVALGHIHKHQVLGEQPPVIYSGSIERIDFGESREVKGFVLATVERGRAQYEFVPLDTRPFIDCPIVIAGEDGFMDVIMENLPRPEQIAGAICRLRLEYPFKFDALLDERLIRGQFTEAFDLRIVKHRVAEDRTRTGSLVAVETLGPYELLDHYWRLKSREEEEIDELLALATEVLNIHAPGPRVNDLDGSATET